MLPSSCRGRRLCGSQRIIALETWVISAVIAEEALYLLSLGPRLEALKRILRGIEEDRMKRLVAIVVSALVAVTGAWAQNYPTRPVNLIVPYPPGGLSDAVARPVAEGMQGPLGQNIVIANVGGASGSIGSARAARAAPDGYTLLLGIWNTHVAVAKLLKLDYDVVKDFAPVAFMTDAPLLLTVHKNVPVNTFKELVGWLTANPD